MKNTYERNVNLLLTLLQVITFNNPKIVFWQSPGNKI